MPFMRKAAWIGVATAVLLVAVLTLYFMLKTDNIGRTHHDHRNKTLIPTPNATQTTPNITQTPQPPQNVAKPPFNASSYEVNYTLVFAVSYGGIAATIEGWMVIGVGPYGNYSFGMFTMPLVGVAAYKTVTMEDGVYTLMCALGGCRVVEEDEWPFDRLIDGVNVTRTVLGQCRWLNYTGVVYEERGVLDPKAFSRTAGGLTGNYTAYVCEVHEVVLSADLVSTAIVNDAPVRVTLKMEAVKAGPYNADTHRQILQEVEEKLRDVASE
jgi:hypothetical protein